MSQKPIGIYYEQQQWFRPLFAELDRRGAHWTRIDAVTHSYAPDSRPQDEYAVVLNKMSPSAWNRGNGDQIFYTLGYLEHLERNGVRVINGLKAFRNELSKASQMTLLQKLGLDYPKTRVLHRAAQVEAAVEGLRWPVVVKPNIGGSGAGVRKFTNIEDLRAAAAVPGELAFGMDSTALVQEFIPARGAQIVRVEVLNGKFLYAIKINITGETFDLCPLDICKAPDGREVAQAAEISAAMCVTEAKKGLSVEGYDLPREIQREVEAIMAEAGVELGGVEYMIDDRDGRRVFYDINALSNFVADGVGTVGFDPFARLADWLEAEQAKVNAGELVAAGASAQLQGGY
jgi:hypothetical protein